ncbi:OmpA family protein [Allohahella marinimesophila]|uniref:OmpA-like domain-containing protein n=1 Tax=Allohahella marinimesophila TaxID=1054972 RepID=A0ABP7PRN7_9GAMM
MQKFNVNVSRSTELTKWSSRQALTGASWARALLLMFAATSSTVYGASTKSPFFDEYLVPEHRLDISLPKALSLSIFEQSKRIASTVSFPKQPFVTTTTSDPSTSDQMATAPVASDDNLFDSFTIVFDAAEESGLPEIMAETVSQLTMRGARMIDSCAGAECGDSQRWNERFKLYGAGPLEQQAYQRLSTSAPSNVAEEFITDIFEVYATRLGCCVRLAVTHYKPSIHQYHVQQDGRLDPLMFPQQSFAVYFDTGQAELDAPQREALLRNTLALNACTRDRRILLEGHTDVAGSSEDNMALSERRLANVWAALATAGLPQDCLVTAAYGDTAPGHLPAAQQRKVVVRMLSAGWGESPMVANETGASPGTLSKEDKLTVSTK